MTEAGLLIPSHFVVELTSDTESDCPPVAKLGLVVQSLGLELEFRSISEEVEVRRIAEGSVALLARGFCEHTGMDERGNRLGGGGARRRKQLCALSDRDNWTRWE